MQVLRVGGEHLAGRRENARSALVIITGAGTVGVVALSVGLHPLAGVVLAITVASAVAKAHRSLRRITKGILGETAVAERLRSLPDDYFLLNDVVLPGHPGNIDHVVIGPCGIVVIETKNFSGSVDSHAKGWFDNSRRSRSISKRANRGAIAVRETLSRAHPDLEGSVLRHVDSIAVFTKPPSRVRVDRAETIVARHSQLLDVILAIARRKRVPPAVGARLAGSLMELTSAH
jgi:Nuclease-related domain